MSLCDKCFDPGRCCKRLMFFAGGEHVTFWLDEPILPQMTMHTDDAGRVNPFKVQEITDRYKDEDGREYGTIVFECTKLLPDGRCGIYEDRPWLCRVFPEGEDRLCVHYNGAEGGEGVDGPMF